MPRRRRFRPNYPLLAAIAFSVLVIGGYIGLGVLTAWLNARPKGMPSTLYLAFVAKCLDATLAVWFFAVGSSIGSFLNVVAYRLPLGKTLGGHSACPFCETPIKSSDNIPVLAWLRLRGRCRACRLPISIQYPLVELAVGLVFLSIYFSEFGLAGTNLPGSGQRPQGLGLIWMAVSNTLIWRVIVYVFVLSGFIAAALMIVRHSRPPLTLFAWLALPLFLAPIVNTSTLIVPWNGAQTGVATTHSGVVLTLACGLACGLVTSALTLPLIMGIGNVPEGQPPRDHYEHAFAWIGTVICAGLLLGWQAVPTFVTLTLLITLVAGMLSQVPALREPVTWGWLGLLLLRANWKWIDGVSRELPLGAPWGGPVLLLGLAILLAWLVGTRRPVFEAPVPGFPLSNLESQV